MTESHAFLTPDAWSDNHGQYSRTGILRYEKIFGRGYVSTGGPETTDYLCSKLGDALRPGVRVLDVGSGIGGAAFHLARVYGAKVTGIDLCAEMVGNARERSHASDAAKGVEFILGNILDWPFDQTFDLIWSRDALMHVADKPRAYSRLFDLLEPGGRVAITDYGCGSGPLSAEFLTYAEQTGYYLIEPSRDGALLEAAGFREVVVEDATERFLDILRRESERLLAFQDDFLSVFSQEDLQFLIDRWAMKIRFCEAGDMTWGIYEATRPA